jgi:hypothetical protein
MLDNDLERLVAELPDSVLSHLGRNHPQRLSKRWQNKLFDAEVLYLKSNGEVAVTRAASFAISEMFQKRFMVANRRGERRIKRGRPGGWGG